MKRADNSRGFWCGHNDAVSHERAVGDLDVYNIKHFLFEQSADCIPGSRQGHRHAIAIETNLDVTAHTMDTGQIGTRRLPDEIVYLMALTAQPAAETGDVLLDAISSVQRVIEYKCDFHG